MSHKKRQRHIRYYKVHGRYYPPSDIKRMGLKIKGKQPYYLIKGRYYTGRQARSKR
jgi:hypothetical protein